jgi:hypothetical protein
VNFTSHVRLGIPKGDGILLALDFDPTCTPGFDDRLQEVIT